MNETENVTRIYPQRNRLVTKDGQTVTTYEFDDQMLYVEWRRGGLSGTRSFPLSRLSPRMLTDTSIDDKSLKQVRFGLLSLLAATVIWFSDIQPHIPLLAPALGLIGAIPLLGGLRNIVPRTWTRICDDYGNVETSIPCSPDINDSERESFVRSLTRAIERARESEGWWY